MPRKRNHARGADDEVMDQIAIRFPKPMLAVDALIAGRLIQVHHHPRLMAEALKVRGSSRK